MNIGIAAPLSSSLKYAALNPPAPEGTPEARSRPSRCWPAPASQSASASPWLPPLRVAQEGGLANAPLAIGIRGNVPLRRWVSRIRQELAPQADSDPLRGPYSESIGRSGLPFGECVMCHRVMLRLALVLTTPLALLAACDREDDITRGLLSQTGVTVAAESTGVSAGRTGDEAITAEVKRQLGRDTDLGALDIDVHTGGGRVVLRGSVPTTALRDRATALSSAVAGVAAVDNELNVQAR
jgi:hypothetical protein